MNLKSLLLSLIFFSNLVLAETFTDTELQSVGWIKNATLSKFIDDHNFPKQLTREIAENLGLLRDVDKYSNQAGSCKETGFYFANFWDEKEPVLMKTIAPSHLGGAMNKADFQRQWDKVFVKFGKPQRIESQEEWLIFRAGTHGTIKFAQYLLNWHQTPLIVRFEISTDGCFNAIVFYEETVVRKLINQALEGKKTKKDLISDSLR